MNPEALVTAHFKQKEYIVSEMFPELAAKIELTNNDLANIYHLSSTTVEPERVYSGEITHILQGKRSDELAEALSGAGFNPSPTSKHFFDHPFDCAIDFQKKVFRIEDDKKVLDITRSRVRTICAFFWIVNNCPHAFGTMYYQYPKDDRQIGFIHIDSITPGKPFGQHFIREN